MWPKQLPALQKLGASVTPALIEFFAQELSGDYPRFEAKPGLVCFCDILMELGDAHGGPAYVDLLATLPNTWVETFADVVARFATRYRSSASNVLPVVSVRWVMSLSPTSEAILQAQEQCSAALALLRDHPAR